MDGAAPVQLESAIFNLSDGWSDLLGVVKVRTNSDPEGVRTSLCSAFRDTRGTKP